MAMKLVKRYSELAQLKTPMVYLYIAAEHLAPGSDRARVWQC